jgi:tetratricopeptide (TPR) repeat protein
MDIICIFIVVGVVIALMLQASSCFFSPERPLSVGFLDFLLAAVVLFISISLYVNQTVIASEFGAVMVNGKVMAWLVRTALVVFPMVPALCWYRIRKLNDWKSHLWMVLLPAVLLGICSASRVLLLNPGDPLSLRVYIYDVWWPPMILWLALCFCGSVLALVDTPGNLLCAAFTSAIIAALAVFALHHQDLSDPRSRPVWTFIERLSFTTAVLLVAWIGSETVGNKMRRALVIAALAIVCMYFALSVETGTRLRIIPIMSDNFRTALALIPVTFFAIGIIVVIIDQFPKLRRKLPVEAGQPAAEPAEEAPSYTSKFLQIGRLSGIVLSISLPVIAFCTVDLFSLGCLNRAADFLTISILWLFFAERLAEGALDNLPKVFKNGVLQLTVLKKPGAVILLVFSSARQSVAGVVKFVTESSQSGPMKAIFATATLVVGTIAALMFLTALEEITNHQSIVIQSFRWVGSSDSKDDISAGISDALINALGRLRLDLQPDLIIAERTSTGEHPGEVRLLRASSDTSSIETAAAKSDELQIAGVKLPVTFFAAPIQRSIRSLLGTRVIAGTVRKSSDGSYMLLANSSTGETWLELSRVPVPEENKSDGDKHPVSVGSSSSSKTSAQASNSSPGECGFVDNFHSDITADLIEKLAFDVASSEPSFISAGLTSNWDAFRYFRSGLAHWNSYQIQNTPARTDELQKAVVCFRRAVLLDRNFALADYRLGVAMQQDGQPNAAVEAFRESVEANPNFVPGASAEAQTLYDFATYYPNQPAALDVITSTVNRREAAIRIWARLIGLHDKLVSLSERRSLYYGVCLYQLNKLQEPKNDNTKLFYLPYFFCSEAKGLFSRLSAFAVQDMAEKSLQASVLDTLGVVLDSHRGDWKAEPASQFPNSWSCTSNSINPNDLGADGSVTQLSNFGSRTSAAALQYYRDSLQLVPTDEVVKCNEAMSMAFVDNDMTAIEYLTADSMAHATLAFSLVTSARAAAHAADPASSGAKETTSGYYNRALAEFQKAIELDPEFIDALDNYGYTYWLWRVDWLKKRASLSPPPELAIKAEAYVRAGVRLARTRQLLVDEANLRDTLGELLLAQGRTPEAIEQLELAANTNYRWDGLNESRWDLAFAEICSAGTVKNASDKQKFLDEATNNLLAIEAAEQNREFQPFTTTQDALDPLLWEQRCASTPDSRDQFVTKGFPYILRNRIYKGVLGCAWSGVVAKLTQKPEKDYFLHVWGGGVDQRIPINDQESRSVQLEAPPHPRSAYFFAQMEDAEQRAVSPVDTLETLQDSQKNNCSHSWLSLLYGLTQQQAFQH